MNQSTSTINQSTNESINQSNKFSNNQTRAKIWEQPNRFLVQQKIASQPKLTCIHSKKILVKQSKENNQNDCITINFSHKKK